MIDCKISRVFLYLFLVIFFGCESKTISEDLNIYRFENEFYKSNEDNLHLLMKKYPYLFPNEFPIDSWKSFLKDPTRLSVYKESKKVSNALPPIFLKCSKREGVNRTTINRTTLTRTTQFQ